MADEHKRTFETFETTVGLTEVISPRIKRIRFDMIPGHPFYFQAGQFAQVFVPTPEKVRRTSYSIASAPYHHESFELCVTHVEGGVSSTFLHNLKVGDKVTAMGPLGKFTLPDPLPRDLVFIATGSGIAPLRSMIWDLFHKNPGRSMSLLFGNRFEEDILYRTEWEDLAKACPGFQFLHTLSRAADTWKGQRGYVQEAIPSFVPNPVEKDFYICGLVKMIEGVSDKLASLGVPKEQIHFERYD